jgi:hypothetical protein
LAVTSTVNPNDRATWPEVLFRVDLVAILRCSLRQIDRMKRDGALPDPIPGTAASYSKTVICAWLDNPRSHRGWRRIAS